MGSESFTGGLFASQTPERNSARKETLRKPFNLENSVCVYTQGVDWAPWCLLKRLLFKATIEVLDQHFFSVTLMKTQIKIVSFFLSLFKLKTLNHRVFMCCVICVYFCCIYSVIYLPRLYHIYWAHFHLWIYARLCTSQASILNIQFVDQGIFVAPKCLTHFTFKNSSLCSLNLHLAILQYN